MQISRRLSEELFRLFVNLGHAAHRGTDKPVLSPVSFTLLGALTRSDLRASELSALTGLDQSTLSRRITSLCEHDLVERIPDPADGRAHLVRPTAKGRDLVAGERERRVRTITDVLGDWPDDDRAELARLIAQLNDSLETPRRGQGDQ